MMLLLYWLLFCSLSPLRYYATGQEPGKHLEPGADHNKKDEPIVTPKILERYVIENDFSPSIFGSYKYDPLLQQFDVAHEFNNATTASGTSEAQNNNIHTSTPTRSSHDANENKESTAHKFLRSGRYSSAYGEMVTNPRPKPMNAKKITIP